MTPTCHAEGRPRVAAGGRREDVPIAALVHLNGPPCVGKSTIAAALVHTMPMALLLDIDEIRLRLGGWREDPRSKRVARGLGFSMAAEHLRAGHDVVLPQLTVLDDVVDRLESIAAGAGATYVGVVLAAPREDLVERIRRTHRGAVPAHPRDLQSTDELEAALDFAAERLADIVSRRPWLRLVDVGSLGPEEAAAAVVRSLPI